MLNLKDQLLSSYDYDLPKELIAQTPLNKRHESRLMIVKEELNDISFCEHSRVWNLKDELLSGDLLVLNNTRVLKARLEVRLKGGGLAELLLLEPYGDGLWLCLCRPGKRIRPGDFLFLEVRNQPSVRLHVVRRDESSGGRIIQFPRQYTDRVQMEGFLDLYGKVPLPPYIDHHKNNETTRYQTLYASVPGAVAAPTAGLHLSEELINELEKKGVNFAQITLHVGIGTFKPLETERLNDLHLHSEWAEVSTDVIQAVKSCKLRGGRVFGVGTTTVRAIEAAFLLGEGQLRTYSGNVDLVIQPGFKFGVIDGLLTNFHLPKSSLLLLVSALIGRRRLLDIYKNAIKHKYRFFSYGDAMLITPEAILASAKSNHLKGLE